MFGHFSTLCINGLNLLYCFFSFLRKISQLIFCLWPVLIQILSKHSIYRLTNPFSLMTHFADKSLLFASLDNLLFYIRNPFLPQENLHVTKTIRFVLIERLSMQVSVGQPLLLPEKKHDKYLLPRKLSVKNTSK